MEHDESTLQAAEEAFGEQRRTGNASEWELQQQPEQCSMLGMAPISQQQAGASCPHSHGPVEQSLVEALQYLTGPGKAGLLGIGLPSAAMAALECAADRVVKKQQRSQQG